MHVRRDCWNVAQLRGPDAFEQSGVRCPNCPHLRLVPSHHVVPQFVLRQARLLPRKFFLNIISPAFGNSHFQGDTGGPVVFKFSSELTFSLLGINSIYQGCPSTYPMAYTRVGPYLKWIKSKVPKLL